MAIQDNQQTIQDLLQGLKGIYAETNLSANMIRDSIRRLLKEFGIDPPELKIYLRQDRNAADEVND